MWQVIETIIFQEVKKKKKRNIASWGIFMKTCNKEVLLY